MDLSQQRELLRVARDALAECLGGGRPPRVSAPPEGQPRGVFVSLHHLREDGVRELRGCLGALDLREPLAEAVARMAVAAATRDPRFPPVRPDELDRLEVEISLLSPLRPMASAEELVIGRHGLHVSRGGHNGLLLPQVAREHGWDREQFLAHACLKAGLPENAWRDPETRLEVFDAEVFRDR